MIQVVQHPDQLGHSQLALEEPDYSIQVFTEARLCFHGQTSAQGGNGSPIVQFFQTGSRSLSNDFHWMIQELFEQESTLNSRFIVVDSANTLECLSRDVRIPNATLDLPLNCLQGPASVRAHDF